MSIANLLTSQNPNDQSYLNITVNDLVVDGNESILGNLTVAGSITASGGIITPGNITVQNANPSISILNNATNVNRSTLVLQGAAALAATPTKIQQATDGTFIIEDFTPNVNINLIPHGTGVVQITGGETISGNLLVNGSSATISGAQANIFATVTSGSNSPSLNLTQGANPLSSIYVDTTGKLNIQNLSSADINLNPLTGFVDLNGPNYPAGPYPLTLNSSNQIVAGTNPISTGLFTPQLQFGGASVGITYNLQIGKYTQVGNIVFFNLEIALTSKGSSTGAATVIGLPFTFASSFITSSPVYSTAITTASHDSDIFANGSVLTPGSLGFIAVQTSVPTGVGLLDTNFSNTSSFIITGSYFTS
jgi:hypothetical protein